MVESLKTEIDFWTQIHTKMKKIKKNDFWHSLWVNCQTRLYSVKKGSLGGCLSVNKTHNYQFSQSWDDLRLSNFRFFTIYYYFSTNECMRKFSIPEKQLPYPYLLNILLWSSIPQCDLFNVWSCHYKR